ncbi:Alkylated DNA repair protein ALKBH8-like protein [Colletotrichum sp. SAR 10_98]|nr:Alkylated DNA repair protein ALKBH8-like protein [Colletotrichum sp. SAR 10_98]
MEELPIEPRGLFWQDDFITAEHEARLIDIFRHELEWPTDRGAGRLSLHYGYTFDYKTFGVDPAVPFRAFPEWLRPLIPTREGRDPDQVCLQHYPPGAGIPPHVDTHSAYDQLYALSLGSGVVMQFSRVRAKTAKSGGGEGEGAENGGEEKETVEVDLTPRSMLQMSGDSRLHWTHGIRKRKTDTLKDGTVRRREDRWSITYRWVREPAVCECGDVRLCDTAQRRAGIEREYRWKKGDADGEKKGEEGVKDG